ncbi:MAG: YajQ family cyclic di-GMP-binding protein [Candidatus Omnitrophica bacterium CG11_big_fil_rev_8_21_14_0_20_64_10]|nr:MAG: YajQ family cyclic di-GMP-binding protein [Candidatus Omnitrophica bacterium CG11_big_fil_rev_8_21_14_0_20_64_10]
MAKDHSFDIVSKTDLQELQNALSQARKEIANRFDFKGSSAAIEFLEEPPAVKLTADHSMQLKSVMDVLDGKLVKRGVALKAFSWKEPEQLPSGSMKQQGTLQQGIASEKAREIVKEIKGLGLKVQPRIDGDAVRVSGKQLDDLQVVITALKGKDFGIPLQFENYR